jgi:hypothetical protein
MTKHFLKVVEENKRQVYMGIIVGDRYTFHFFRNSVSDFYIREGSYVKILATGEIKELIKTEL